MGVAEKYDIKVNLNGGGFKGQAEALRLAIARALVKINPEDKPALKSEGFMTRDPRTVERKKPDVPKLVRDSSSVNVNMRRPEAEDIFVFSIQTARTFLFIGNYLVVV